MYSLLMQQELNFSSLCLMLWNYFSMITHFAYHSEHQQFHSQHMNSVHIIPGIALHILDYLSHLKTKVLNIKIKRLAIAGMELGLKIWVSISNVVHHHCLTVSSILLKSGVGGGGHSHSLPPSTCHSCIV